MKITKSNRFNGATNFRFMAVRGCAILASVIVFVAISIVEKSTLSNDIFLISSTMTIFFLILFVSKRPLFSIIIVGALCCAIFFISTAKFKFTSINLHILDLIFYGGRVASFTYNASVFTKEFNQLIILLVISLAAIIWTALIDIRLRRGAFIGFFGSSLSIVLACTTAPLLSAERIAMHQMNPNHPISSAYVSVADFYRLIAYQVARRPLAGPFNVEPYPETSVCQRPANAPNIVTVLSESSVPPSYFDQWAGNISLNDQFKSSDNKLHSLLVDTWGGATWVSEFQFLTGIAPSYFRWMKYYVTLFMEGKVRHSLAFRLRQCGYRTIYMTTGSEFFANIGSFMRSIGFDEIYDARGMGLSSYHERDSVYMNFALELLRRQSNDDKPLFIFMLTSTPHAPYTFRFDPAAHVDGEPFSNEAEHAEYLRRLSLSRSDLAYFRNQIEQHLGYRGVLLAEFGDHQPAVTLPFVSRDGDEDYHARLTIAAYRTSYSIWTIGFSPEHDHPSFPLLDLSHLAISILDMAGIERGPVFEGQASVRDHCGGLDRTCKDQTHRELHIERMIRSGLLTSR